MMLSDDYALRCRCRRLFSSFICLLPFLFHCQLMLFSSSRFLLYWCRFLSLSLFRHDYDVAAAAFAAATASFSLVWLSWCLRHFAAAFITQLMPYYAPCRAPPLFSLSMLSPAMLSRRFLHCFISFIFWCRAATDFRLPYFAFRLFSRADLRFLMMMLLLPWCFLIFLRHFFAIFFLRDIAIIFMPLMMPFWLLFADIFATLPTIYGGRHADIYCQMVRTQCTIHAGSNARRHIAWLFHYLFTPPDYTSSLRCRCFLLLLLPDIADYYFLAADAFIMSNTRWYFIFWLRHFAILLIFFAAIADYCFHADVFFLLCHADAALPRCLFRSLIFSAISLFLIISLPISPLSFFIYFDYFFAFDFAAIDWLRFRRHLRYFHIA